ncbi:MAG: agmatine deiminase family protein [Verrucomicrobia bacterium]|nr:MAG: agmatine deiminase family protein [Verrucomicrobiota bacterium]
MPAEWEPQEGVWLSWPHNLETWPGKFEPIPPKFGEITATISRFEPVFLNCPEDLQVSAVKCLIHAEAEMEQVRFFDHPTNDSWCRDHGPIFIRHDETGEIAATDWRYNSWGGKYPPFDLDNNIPGRISEALGLRRFVFEQVLEGGSIEVNGAGDLLTTEACLLNPNRNPNLSRAEIEGALRQGLGVDRILWIGEGIIGDDTDGHVDDLARFYASDGIVTCLETDRDDANFPILEENLERLKTLRTRDGDRFKINTLPMPEPCVHEGQRMPASYANFLIINEAVLMPTFRQGDRDSEATSILACCFPDREIITIDCFDLVWGLGTLHCISQQQPESMVDVRC